MSMSYIGVPVSSVAAVEALLDALFTPGADESFLPVQNSPISGGIQYFALHDDPNASTPNGDPITGHRQEAWAVAYLRGDFADNPAYAPPVGVVELVDNETQTAEQQYFAMLPVIDP